MIFASSTVTEYVGKKYTDYNFAYVGKSFSETFKQWNYKFVQDIISAYNSTSSNYKGSVCTIKSNFYRLKSGEIIMYISSVIFSPLTIALTYRGTNLERTKQGMPSIAPPLVASTKRVSDYSYYTSGGTYGQSIIDIVKKKNNYKRKPLFNYYNRSTRAIMFDYDFYSAFPFNGNQAEAWATDGHKYQLPYMQLLESKQSKLDRIITEVLNNFLRRELLLT